MQILDFPFNLNLAFTEVQEQPYRLVSRHQIIYQLNFMCSYQTFYRLQFDDNRVLHNDIGFLNLVHPVILSNSHKLSMIRKMNGKL